MYDNQQIARELHATAQGDYFYGNSLRVAKDIRGLTDTERSLLDRCARRGVACFVDRMALQDLAIKVANTEISTNSSVGHNNG